MANEFIIKNGFISKGDGEIDGSLYSTGSSATGTTSFAFGSGTIASGNNSFVTGVNNQTNSENSSIIGGDENVISSTLPNSSIIGGDQNIISTNSGGVILGGGLNIIQDNSSGLLLNSINSIIKNNSRLCSVSNTLTGVGLGAEIDSSSESSISNAGNSTEISGSSNSFIYGGSRNKIVNSQTSAIISSEGNTASSSPIVFPQGIFESENSLVLGGNGGNYIGDGKTCSIISSYSSSIARNDASLNYPTYSVILGGELNGIRTSSSVSRENCIVGGKGTLPRRSNSFTLGYNAGATLPGELNNTFSVDFSDGTTYSNGVFNVSNADYAEYFEWLDGNLDNEERVGYFVSLTGSNIEIGNYNIIGVVSGVPAIVGDSAYFHWKDMYDLDEFGRKQYVEFQVLRIKEGEEEFKVYSYSGNTEGTINYTIVPNQQNLKGVIYTGNTSGATFLYDKKVPKINPKFIPNTDYIPREDRPEWSPVGLLGKLHVRTAELITGSTISTNSDGMAINGSDYHVLKEVMGFNEDKGYGVVQILFK